MVTYFVVLRFQLGKNGVLIADEPKEAQSKDQCLAVARRSSEGSAGVIAFSRTGDPSVGDWEDAVVLWRHGIVPEEVFEMVG